MSDFSAKYTEDGWIVDSSSDDIEAEVSYVVDVGGKGRVTIEVIPRR